MDFTTTRAQIVTACYRHLLGREPDDEGLANLVSLPKDRFSLELVLETLVGSAEYIGRVPAGRPSAPPADDLFHDRSQFGEVRHMLTAMVNGAARHRIVVDVGANGIVGSNSYDLLRHFGWRGLLIEANPARCEAIRRDFSGLDFELLQVAVSDHAGEATFFLGVNDDVSSLTAEAAAAWGEVKGELRVRVEPLSAILAARGIPPDYDLLTVDAEGEDCRILNESTAAGFLPQWVIIEASQDFAITNLDQLPLSPLVRGSYSIVARTRANLILTRANGAAAAVLA